MGRPREARSDRVPRDRGRRADRRARERRDRRDRTSAPMQTTTTGPRGIEGVEIRVAGGPNSAICTINGTSANLQDVRSRRRWRWPSIGRRSRSALLGPLGIDDAEPLGNHIFMANQAGYRDNSGDSAPTILRGPRSCSTRPVGSSTATVRKRTANRSKSRSSFRAASPRRGRNPSSCRTCSDASALR